MWKVTDDELGLGLGAKICVLTMEELANRNNRIIKERETG